jgi:hypothetical protein
LGVKAAERAWWDSERWDRELGDELLGIQLLVSTDIGKATAAALGGEYDGTRTVAYLDAISRRIAPDVNANTLLDLENALDADEPTEEIAAVFDTLQNQAAVAIGAGVVSQAAGFGTVEAAKQLGGDAATKTWTTGSNPRPSHAALNGETVGIDDTFSNGARWPGDSSLEASDRAGCNCSVEVEIP